MHLDFPLEQLVKRRGVAFQFGFATEAKRLIWQAGQFAAAASHNGLHLLAPKEDALAWPAQVKRALRRRPATLSGEYARATYCVLRDEAPLANLLGFGTELRSLTAGSAKHWIALSHYALVTRDPGGSAA